MNALTIRKPVLLLMALLLSLPILSAEDKDPEEERLYNKSITLFDGQDDQDFYDAIIEYRNYVREKGYVYKYWNSWNNEIIYDINHDHYYLALKKTEEMETKMKEAEAREYYFMIDYLMGVFYGTRDNNDLCEQHLLKALEQTDPKKNVADQVAIYQMLANICIFGNGEQGLAWADKAIAISEDNYQLCGSVGVKAMIAFTHAEQQIFENCYSRIEKLRKEYPDDYYPIYQDYVDMGRYAFDGDYERAFAMADSLQSETERLAFRAVICKRKGDLVGENETLKMLLNAKERRNNEISTLTINEINRDFELNKARLEQRRAELYTIIAIFVFLIATILLLAYMGWTRHKHLKLMEAKNRELEKARDQAEVANRMKMAFIQNVSHQIRTPLNAISGFSDILATQTDDLSDDERHDLSRRISHNTDILTNSLNHLLSLSDMESAVSWESEEAICCDAFCREILSEFKPSNQALSLHYTTDVSPDVTVRTNRRMLKAIVDELLSNADKFTDEGTITVSSTIADGFWKIGIADTGRGIQPGEEEQIFGHFTKIDDFSEGMGIGLTFCKNVALRLNGDVILDRTYSPGSRFIVQIPAEVLK